MTRWALVTLLTGCEAPPVEPEEQPTEPVTPVPRPDTGTPPIDTAVGTTDTHTPPPAVCGDGVLEPTEACDDGNLIDGDSCSSTCVPPELTNLRLSSLSVYGGSGEGVGLVVAAGGDLTGDGLPDTLVEGFTDNAAGQSVSAMYVLSAPLAGDLSVAEAWSAALIGKYPGDGDIRALVASAAGDLNGDGFADLVLGDFTQGAGADVNKGAAWVLYGPLSGTVEVATAGVELSGEAAGDSAGTSVAGGADVDGDGVPDLLVGAPSNDKADLGAGSVYLLRGGPDGVLALSEAYAQITGAAVSEGVGEQVALGDLSGDGVADVVFTASASDAGALNSGVVYVVYGPTSGLSRASDGDAQFVGDAEDSVGSSFALGDLDGDGSLDFAVSGAEPYGRGRVYVVPGPIAGALDPADAVAEIIGEAASDNTGSVASGGDLDGDGVTDLVVGAPTHDAVNKNEGAVYVMLGPIQGRIDPIGGALKLQGEFGECQAGTSVAVVGDFDGDGFDDAVAGAPYVTISGKEDAGRAYLISGGF